MKNAIIINGETYELVENTTDKNVCETCAFRDTCQEISSSRLCVALHNAKLEEHYIKRPKGGKT